MPPKRSEPESFENSPTNRVRESASVFALPEFDSLPATAGLSNLQAFQLSLRHALSLLPALFLHDQRRQNAEEETERFYLS